MKGITNKYFLYVGLNELEVLALSDPVSFEPLDLLPVHG